MSCAPVAGCMDFNTKYMTYLTYFLAIYGGTTAIKIRIMIFKLSWQLPNKTHGGATKKMAILNVLLLVR
jgi:hypothetical protein